MPYRVLRDIDSTREERVLEFLFIQKLSCATAEMLVTRKAVGAASLKPQSGATKAWRVARWSKLGRRLAGSWCGARAHEKTLRCFGKNSGAGGGSRTLTGFPPTDFRTSYGLRRPVWVLAPAHGR
jgi:hypothetical protein